ncbi:orotidine-5'-phosphate decarboxylase [Lacimicrobium alkaliphilum]|uniref:Orotidine 5'-phosphate decarboxylase n=1 Tax=Lacimicrobium alkaliphilum TaxID=1526571 RepID=A0A0U3AKQ4_9ALTE|nr:orotidine-5'-phosphate decarboxylase [Lacimicrobium alkaliphilum]ALS98546.1 orotidine 5'-phosphate decarboxylase [Lacimicrobium alkaliphilum]
MNDAKVVVALDFDSEHKALSFADSVDPRSCRLKVGKEMFTYFGPALVKQLVARDFDVFLDLKFHDIPTTVGRACIAAAELGVWMVNVHASGGSKMMRESLEALQQFGDDRPILIAVTVLTSMSAEDLTETGIRLSPAEQVSYLAGLAKHSGLDGVVCSAQEARTLKQQCGTDFKLVTPGIRPKGAAQGDQQRVMTPQQALQAGVDYMVIGRPITQAEDPAMALDQINQSLQQG